jgi:hypothetical protein
MPPTAEPEPLPLLLDVPVLAPTQTVSAAILALTQMHRSALIVVGPNRPHQLLHAVDLYRARAEKTSSIGDITIVSSTKFGTPGLENLPTLDIQDNLVPDAIYHEFKLRNLPLAVVRVLPESGTGMLAIASQTLFNEIKSGPADCYCVGPRKHLFPPPSVQSGDVCPFDGHPIYCKI